jgi:hypothetical protein
LRQERPFTEIWGDDVELALDSFLSDKKTRQCRPDIGVVRGIGAGAAACKSRASRSKRQRPMKLAGIHLHPCETYQSPQFAGMPAIWI